jgi:hypothetical protein
MPTLPLAHTASFYSNVTSIPWKGPARCKTSFAKCTTARVTLSRILDMPSESTYAATLDEHSWQVPQSENNYDTTINRQPGIESGGGYAFTSLASYQLGEDICEQDTAYAGTISFVED